MTRLRRLADSATARLVAGYVLIVAVLAGAWAWSLYGPITDAVLRQQERNLTAVAQSSALVAAESSATAAEIADRLVARTDLRMTVIAADGTVLADSDYASSGMENHRARPEVRTALGGGIGVDRRLSRTGNIEELYVAVPASLHGQRVVLRVAQPIADINAIAARSRRSGLTLLGLALITTLLVAIRAARSAVAPVRALSLAANRMASGDLDAEVPTVTSDLADLARALTELRSQVKTRLGALSAERHSLQATLDGLGEAVLLIEGDELLFVNRECIRLFGMGATVPAHARLHDVGLPAPVVAEMTARLDGEAASVVELPPDPLGRTYRVSISPVRESEDSTRRVVVISDVTERARLDRMRRDFVAGASHELKTPVAGIRLLADTAVSAAEDGDTEAALAFVAQIPAEAGRLQHLVSDLLDLSRLETTPSPGTVADLRTAIDRALVSHRGSAARKDLTLTADLSAVEGQDVFVRMDPTDVAIVLDNLIDNAIAYTDSGSVSVSVDAVEDTLTIAVADTGPGIAHEHRDRVFERFYRVDAGRSREHGGTGLGLALVRHVVERAGGSLSLNSVEGAGSTFTVTAPRAR